MKIIVFSPSSAACCSAGVYESLLSSALILLNNPNNLTTGVNVFVHAFLSVPGVIPSGGTLELNSREAVRTSGTARGVLVGEGSRREEEERLRREVATRPRRFRCHASMVSVAVERTSSERRASVLPC